MPVPPQLAESLKRKAPSTKLSPNSKLANSLSNVQINDTVIVDDLPINGDKQTVYKHLLSTLKIQVEKATENYKHFTNMGDIGNANK